MNSIGTNKLTISTTKHLRLTKVFLVPKLATNLNLVGQLVKEGNKITFSDNKYII